MSTREIAYSIIDQLTEEELDKFVAQHSRKTLLKNDEEDLQKRREAFEELEGLRRYIPDLDEKKELDEYRQEKYGR